MEIKVLRLGHRLPRDERISTHVALVARAFGADSVIYSGMHDSSLEDSVKRVCENWGGEFDISYEKNSSKVIKDAKEKGFVVAHLSMYGMPLPEKLGEIKKLEKLLIVVGGERVPAEVYELADFNISVTSQPHSEVAALAVFLERIMDGRQFERSYNKNFKGKIKVEPSESGKDIKKS